MRMSVRVFTNSNLFVRADACERAQQTQLTTGESCDQSFPIGSERGRGRMSPRKGKQECPRSPFRLKSSRWIDCHKVGLCVCVRVPGRMLGFLSMKSIFQLDVSHPLPTFRRTTTTCACPTLKWLSSMTNDFFSPTSAIHSSPAMTRVCVRWSCCTR